MFGAERDDGADRAGAIVRSVGLPRFDSVLVAGLAVLDVALGLAVAVARAVGVIDVVVVGHVVVGLIGIGVIVIGVVVIGRTGLGLAAFGLGRLADPLAAGAFDLGLLVLRDGRDVLAVVHGSVADLLELVVVESVARVDTLDLVAGELGPFVPPESFNPGYMQRGRHLMPKQGTKAPWTASNDYYIEKDEFPVIDLDEPELQYR